MNTHELRQAMDELARDVPDPDFTADDAWRRAQRTRHRRRWLVAAAAAAAVVAIGAGTWLTETFISGSNEQYLSGSEDSVPFATYHGRQDYAPLVGYRGPVTLEDGCIRFGDLPLLLPDDTVWNPERQELSLDGHTLPVGEEIVHGGGPVDADHADYIPDSCRDGQSTKTEELFQMGTLEHSTPSN